MVCISQFARGQLMRISAPLDWAKFQVCRLGVDPRQFTFVAPAEGQSHIRMLTPAKGQVLLVQACAQLRDTGLDFSVTLVGDGPDRARVEQAIAELDLQQHVKLAGSLTQDGVRHALAQSDIFVLPSLAEGIPVVLMEAMSSGVPCVSTPVNGIPELIEHGRTARRPLGDAESLARSEPLAHNEGLRREIALCAREKVRWHFDLARNVQQLSGASPAFRGLQSPFSPEIRRPHTMDLSILIVTYNSAPLIGGLLDHLQAEILSEGESLRAEIIVVDNASRDGTVRSPITPRCVWWRAP